MDSNLIKILEILIDEINDIRKLDVFTKVKIYELSNGQLCNDTETRQMIEIDKKIKEMEEN